MKIKRSFKAVLSAVLCLCLLVSANSTVIALGAESSNTNTAAQSDTVTQTVTETVTTDSVQSASTELKDYSMPSTSSHAYDPFAQLESEEATQEYRDNAQYEEGTIIYKVTETKSAFSSSFNSDAADSDLNGMGINLSSAEELSRKKVDDGVFTDTYEVIYVADLDGDVWETVDALAETDGVVDAQPNYLYEDTAVDVPTITHNPHMDKQWHHGKDHLNCDKYWQHMYEEGITAGEGSIVAVIDTGVDYTHQDIAANMWVNTAEYNGVAGVDDDGNGYIDDIHGVSTVGATRYHSGDPMDDHGHGTHVAGIIAMTANNDEGGVGLAYGTKIMAIKAGQATGVFSDTDVAEAINYAYAMGADVINMSFGGTGKSFLIEEALSDAFSKCVLVAAAGNDSLPTSDAPDDFLKKADFYPAGYSFVLGVMASDQSGNLASFSNWDYYNNGGSAEYEMTAPGVDIYSTLPGNQYAYWDGTSMAAPLVSAAASLIRSAYSDKETYSSRFIMGQLASATDKSLTYIDKLGFGHSYTMLDLDASLNQLPEPNLVVKNTYLFDNPSIDPANDGDGIVDAGETIDLGLVIRNQWGMAGNVTVTVDALSTSGIANPNIEWITDTITLDDVGTFNEQNNSFVYENDALVGVANPIRFKVSKDCINDAHIGFNITITCTNALDPDDTNIYTVNDELYFYVQRGRTISGTITEDMTWTADDYWIVENTVYIPEGVTVTVEPGTQIQFWGSDASDPYAATTMAYIEVDGAFLVNGTEDAPVDMFPSAAFSNYGVDIRSGILSDYAAHPYSNSSSKAELSYANIINPRLNFTKGEHLYIVQESSRIFFRQLSSSNGTVSTNATYGGVLNVYNLYDSKVSAFRNGSTVHLAGRFYNVLFEKCALQAKTHSSGMGNYSFFATGCAFIGETIFDSVTKSSSIYNPSPLHIKLCTDCEFSKIYEYGSNKYVQIKFNSLPYVYEAGYELGGKSGYRNDIYSFLYNAINSLAVNRGGHFANINSDEEKEFLYGMNNDINNGAFIAASVSADGEYTYYSLNGGGLMGERSYFITDNGGIRSVILEYPSTVSDDEILSNFSKGEIVNAAIDAQEYLPDGLVSAFTENAILNDFNQTDMSSWIKLITDFNNSYSFVAQNNYWGTDNEKLIQAQITDADTYAVLADIVTDPYLTLDSPELENIYPFVTEAYITDLDGNRITTCGYEEIQLHVTFNRDMDTSILPMVSYGPAAPYTDYVVDGEFVDARHWVGTTKVKSIIDAGTEYIRIKDAAAADDTWLTTGTDEARFAFTIANTGAEALVMQAVGGENKVELSWTQDDYETLAGFNVYRSTSADGTFTKINSRLVPGTIREYTDTTVEPGVEYFYYFTVVGTDLVESNPSNVAAATPLDNIKPVLSHTRVTAANYGETIAFNATASDNIGVEYIKLYYRATGADSYKSVDMTNIDGNDYYASIAASEVSADGMQYYIEVSDGVSVVRDGSAQYPIDIAVDSTMVIYSVSPAKVDVSTQSDVTAIVTGVNFSDSMTLTVGGIDTEYSFISTSQISFTIPRGNLGRADIKLVDGSRTASLTNAITYTDSLSEIQIVAPGEAKAKETIKLPVTVTANGDVYGVDIQFKLEKSLYSSIKFEKSEANAAAIASCTASSSGVVKVSMASADVIDTTQPIGYLVLTPNNITEAVNTSVQISTAMLNAVSVNSLVDCNMVIRPNFSIGGKITYYNSDEGIAGVKVTLSNGMETYTDEDGNYSFTGITTNNITVVASHTGNVNGAISAQDASLVLQAITGEGEELSDQQFIAADVDGDGQITALDASYILQKSVEKIDGEFPGSGAEWAFDEPVKVLNLTGNLTNVNFEAILLGDVSGDWTSNPQEELE